MERYDPHAYWRALLSGSFNLQGVSWPELSNGFLRWQYRARREALRRVVPNAAGLRVLDVGPGTGYWVALWHALGAAAVAGFDLTETSVTHLRRQFPRDRFEQGDISTTVPPGGPYDLISAIDVLLHITDDTAYARALAHIRRASRPGGRLLLLEPYSIGAAKAFEEGQSSRARPLAAVRPMLAVSGWRVTAVQPALWLLSIPVETEPYRLCFGLNWLWFHVNHFVRGERRGALTGAALYPLDRALCRLPWGPTSKVLVAEAV